MKYVFQDIRSVCTIARRELIETIGQKPSQQIGLKNQWVWIDPIISQSTGERTNWLRMNSTFDPLFL